MKTMEKLVSTYQNKKIGNHRVEIDHVNGCRKFYYYSTVIAISYDSFNKFKIDDSYGSVSTSRACGSYRYEFKSLGYDEATL